MNSLETLLNTLFQDFEKVAHLDFISFSHKKWDLFSTIEFAKKNDFSNFKLQISNYICSTPSLTIEFQTKHIAQFLKTWWAYEKLEFNLGLDDNIKNDSQEVNQVSYEFMQALNQSIYTTHLNTVLPYLEKILLDSNLNSNIQDKHQKIKI